MVRRADIDDLPELLRMGQAFHEKMVYADHEFSAEAFARACSAYIQSPEFGIWIGAKSMAAAMIGEHPATGHWMASEIFLYSETASQGIRLLHTMKKWALAKGAHDLILTDQINMRDLGALYGRVGAVPVERVYRVEL